MQAWLRCRRATGSTWQAWIQAVLESEVSIHTQDVWPYWCRDNIVVQVSPPVIY